jgi:hypothetical protein
MRRKRCETQRHGLKGSPLSNAAGPPSGSRSARAGFRPELGDLLRASVRATELSSCRSARCAGHIDKRKQAAFGCALRSERDGSTAATMGITNRTRGRAADHVKQIEWGAGHTWASRQVRPVGRSEPFGQCSGRESARLEGDTDPGRIRVAKSKRAVPRGPRQPAGHEGGKR